MLKKIDDTWTQGDFINFKDKGRVSKKAVTHVYEVTSRTNGSLIGFVKWFANWRQYTFLPVNCIMEKTCLRDIADFCDELTQARRKKRG